MKVKITMGSPMMFACAEENLHFMKVLDKHGFDWKSGITIKNDVTRMNAFLHLCRNGNMECLKYLLSKSKKYPDAYLTMIRQRNVENENGLHLCVKHGPHLGVFVHLLKNVYFPEKTNNSAAETDNTQNSLNRWDNPVGQESLYIGFENQTLLHLAARGTPVFDTPAIEQDRSVVLKFGISSINDSKNDYETKDTVETNVVDDIEQSVSSVSPPGATQSQITIFRPEHLEIFELCWTAGCSLTKTDDTGYTPVHTACESNNVWLLNHMIKNIPFREKNLGIRTPSTAFEHGPSIRISRDGGDVIATPLVLAVINNNPDCVRLLCDVSGVNEDITMDTIEAAFRYDAVDCFKILYAALMNRHNIKSIEVLLRAMNDLTNTPYFSIDELIVRATKRSKISATSQCVTFLHRLKQLPLKSQNDFAHFCLILSYNVRSQILSLLSTTTTYSTNLATKHITNNKSQNKIPSKSIVDPIDEEKEAEMTLKSNSGKDQANQGNKDNDEDRFPLTKKEVATLNLFDGKYDVLYSIGRGAFGMVVAVLDKSAQTRRALKIIVKKVEWKKRNKNTANEVDALKKIIHPSVIKLYDCDLNLQINHNNKIIYYNALVFELGIYGDLKTFMTALHHHSSHMLRVRLARTYFGNIIDGLDAIHRAGYGHYDLKESNIIIVKQFRVKIADFGLAQYWGSDVTTSTNTSLGGTKGYRAPEIFLPETFDKLTVEEKKRADIFSLGVILYRMLFYEKPFVNDRPVANNLPYIHVFKGKWDKFWQKERNQAMSPMVPYVDIKSFKKLFEKMVQSSPRARITLEDIKKSEWFEKSQPWPLDKMRYKGFLQAQCQLAYRLTAAADREREKEKQKQKEQAQSAPSAQFAQSAI